MLLSGICYTHPSHSLDIACGSPPSAAPFPTPRALVRQFQTRNMSSTSTTAASTRRLNASNINPHVREAKYAVRGELAVKSEEYRAKIAKGDAADLPFSQVISANIGNPQQLDQKPITFFRQVLSLLENPKLLDHEDILLGSLDYKPDVIARARWLLSKAGSVGAYSASNGVPAIRQSVADFLESKPYTRARDETWTTG